MDLLPDILQEFKKDIEKEIIINIDINELAQKLYPILKKIDERSPQNIMKRHIENLQRAMNTSGDYQIVNDRFVIKNKQRSVK